MAFILVVDDENEIRQLLGSVLMTVKDYKIKWASNGEEALELIKKNKFDLMITDLAMPRMNGFELLRRLKIVGHSVPTIVLTGHGDLHIAKQLSSYGIDSFMQKPWNNDELLGVVHKLLTRPTKADRAS